MPNSSTGPGLIAARLAQQQPRCGTARVLAIDGGAAAGKTTLATVLAALIPDSAIIHTDDLLNGWDDEFTFWPRLRSVLLSVSEGRVADVPRYDWHLGRFGEPWQLNPPEVVIVDGVSSLRACGPYLSLGVLIEVSVDERRRRWRERDGKLGPEELRWLEREAVYFAEPITIDVPVLRIAG